MNKRLLGTFKLRSPLSHIGEAISTVTYLVEEPILQPDGTVEPVFVYSGNAWRGQLRDLCATYMLEHLGNARVPLDTFHLLYSGGRIGGDQVIDIDKARAYRRAIPMLALFGGGVGNQILPGKMRVGNGYPICREAIPVLPVGLRRAARDVSYRALTFEKSFSRKDDAKDDRLRTHIADADAAAGARPITPPKATRAPVMLPGMDDVPTAGAPPPEPPKPQRDGPADQMRMTVELLAAGTQLTTRIDLLDVSEIELGALVSGLHAFSRSPHIGGQANRGHGQVELEYEILDLDTNKTEQFLGVADGAALLAPAATAAKASYDAYLREQYDRLLADKGDEMRSLLGARTA